MTDPRSQLRLGVITTVLVLASLAAVALLANFADVPPEKSWAAVPASLGLSLILAGFIEVGLGVGGLSVLALLAGFEVLPPLTQSWPFGLVWIAIVVVIGYVRASAAE